MGAPKPWPTRWPEPHWPIFPDSDDEPPADPDYDIEVDPTEAPYSLPEERWRLASVTWGVTHVCNLRCAHCYDAAPGNRADLTTAQAGAVIDRLAEVGVRFIAFSGGEPLLRRDLFQLIDRCNLKQIGFAMRSNATRVTPLVAQRLSEAGLQVAGISLDGATADAHDAVRGAGAFDQTRAGIEALLAAGIRVNIEVVLTRRNAAQAMDCISLAGHWGVHEINFSALAPQGRAIYLGADFLTLEQRAALIARLREASRTAQVVVSPSCALTGPCASCVEPNITCDGWVTPCYLSAHKLFNLLEVDPADAQARLRQLRAGLVNVCGRTWEPWEISISSMRATAETTPRRF